MQKFLSELGYLYYILCFRTSLISVRVFIFKWNLLSVTPDLPATATLDAKGALLPCCWDRTISSGVQQVLFTRLVVKTFLKYYAVL